jgi:hypothetical protein
MRSCGIEKPVMERCRPPPQARRAAFVHLVSFWTATALAVFLVLGCEAPAAFPVPPGPPKFVAIDANLPVYMLGNWAVRSFTDALRSELAKYGIQIADPKSQPAVATIQIDLGQVTYRQWQAIDVSVVVAGEATPIGHVRVPDLGTWTLEAAAQPVATIIARRIWGVAAPAP